jgi:hypothetical protein
LSSRARSRCVGCSRERDSDHGRQRHQTESERFHRNLPFMNFILPCDSTAPGSTPTNVRRCASRALGPVLT